MSWNYTGRPNLNARDKVRFLSGQTDRQSQLVSDEEIAYALSVQPAPELAAAVICEALAAKFSGLADKRVGDVSESCSQKAAAFQLRAEQLRSNAVTLALPVFGGLSISEKEMLDADTDAVQPSFRIGQDDHTDGPNERENPLSRHDLVGC